MNQKDNNKKEPIPQNFEERKNYFLKHIYNNGGSENKPQIFLNTEYFESFYCKGSEEFDDILESLKSFNFISFDPKEISKDRIIYGNVRLTKEGIKEVEKALPKFPMYGLVNQEITIGDIEIDDKISHARNQFFREPQTTENMRSACETLSFVIEPWRKELKKKFNNKDTSALFNIINNFDVRHNKDQTKQIEHTELFEWIFYSLLNTINTYSKLLKKDVEE